MDIEPYLLILRSTRVGVLGLRERSIGAQVFVECFFLGAGGGGERKEGEVNPRGRDSARGRRRDRERDQGPRAAMLDIRVFVHRLRVERIYDVNPHNIIILSFFK